MSHALSIVLQGLTQCVHHEPFGKGFKKISSFLTIFHHQVTKCLFPGSIGSFMVVSFSPVEHLNLVLVSAILLLMSLMTVDEANASTVSVISRQLRVVLFLLLGSTF